MPRRMFRDPHQRLEVAGEALGGASVATRARPYGSGVGAADLAACGYRPRHEVDVLTGGPRRPATEFDKDVRADAEVGSVDMR